MNTLWYNQPAENWNEAFPVGNGRLGAMVYGRPGHEIIQLNEESVWSGVYKDRNNRSAKESLAGIHEYAEHGQLDRAQELAFESLTGTPSEQCAYQTAGELHIDCYGATENGEQGGLTYSSLEFGDCTAYRRELDLETAVATVSFNSETSVPSTAIFARNSRGSSISYTREVFVSRAMDVIMIHFSANTPKSINFRAYLDRGIYIGRYYSVEDDTLIMQDTHGIPFAVMVTAVSSGGSVHTKGGAIVVQGADEATLYVDIQSAFRSRHYAKKGGNLYRGTRGALRSCTDRALKKICFASSGVYQNIKASHVGESSKKFKRVSLDLSSGLSGSDSVSGADSAKGHPKEALFASTDELVQKYPDSPALSELEWNYGRYIIDSCGSAPGTLPPTVQGIWNAEMNPDDGCRYDLKAWSGSVEWPAGMCRLWECGKPLFDFMKRAYKNGKTTAGAMYGSDGWAAHSASDIWADTAPQGTDIPGSVWPMGSAVLALHVRDYYEYTLDRKFLKKHFKLLMRSCEFFADSAASGFGADKKILRRLVNAALDSARDLEKSDTDSNVLFLRQFSDSLKNADSGEAGGFAWPEEFVAHGDRQNKRLSSPGPESFMAVSEITGKIVRSRMTDGVVVIDLLPDLPPEWQNGELKNVAVKGNLGMDISWKNGSIEAACIYAAPGSTFAEKVEINFMGRMYKAPLTDGRLDIKNILPTTV